jgi:hypothetical protein
MTSSNGTNIATKIKQFLRDTFQPLAPPILDYPPPDTQSANHLSPIQPIVIHPPSNLTQSDNRYSDAPIVIHPPSNPTQSANHYSDAPIVIHPPSNFTQSDNHYSDAPIVIHPPSNLTQSADHYPDPIIIDPLPNLTQSSNHYSPPISVHPPSNLAQSANRQGTSRPHPIAELAERAKQSLGDDIVPIRPFKAWLRIAENARRDAKVFHEQGDLKSAFVEYAKAAIIVLEKIPSHPDYRVLLSTTQRRNMDLVSYL